MNKITTYRKSDADYYDWLIEPVYWNGGANLQMSRAKAISIFVKEGLYPFLLKKGYSWGCSVEHLQYTIASGLYENIGKHYLDSHWDYQTYNNDYTDEDLWHYDFVMDEDTWSDFWSRWAVWCDIDPSTERGIDRQNDIQKFCWTQLHLDKSVQTQILMEYMRNGEIEDYMEARNKKEDIYLKEAADSNQWDGWRR